MVLYIGYDVRFEYGIKYGSVLGLLLISDIGLED